MATAATSPPFKIVTGADAFGCKLKDSLTTHLKSLNIEVIDIAHNPPNELAHVDVYWTFLFALPSVHLTQCSLDQLEQLLHYTIAYEVGRRVSADPSTTRGLVACGTGVGVAIFANKLPNVYCATCLTVPDAVNARSINNCNVLAVSGNATSPELAIEILEAWLSTPFKAPCPASGNEPWSKELESFLDNSLLEMSKLGASPDASCSICDLVKSRVFEEISLIQGGSMKIMRESPTSAIVRFKAGSVEPAHHHSFGHDLVVMKGSKKVWNLSKGESYELGVGDYLFTPAGDVHRVKYFEDTEFFIKWDGKWDLLFDEDAATAKDAIEKESATIKGSV